MRIKAERHQGWLAGALWAREHTPPNAIFAIKDAGFFGYFSDRRVINLDGKANGYTYQGYVDAGDVERYLHEVNVEYVADIGARYRSEQYPIVIPRPNRSPVILWMSEGDEVYRSRPIPRSAARFGAAPTGHFAVWRYSRSLSAL